MLSLSFSTGSEGYFLGRKWWRSWPLCHRSQRTGGQFAFYLVPEVRQLACKTVVSPESLRQVVKVQDSSLPKEAHDRRRQRPIAVRAASFHHRIAKHVTALHATQHPSKDILILAFPVPLSARVATGAPDDPHPYNPLFPFLEYRILFQSQSPSCDIKITSSGTTNWIVCTKIELYKSHSGFPEPVSWGIVRWARSN